MISSYYGLLFSSLLSFSELAKAALRMETNGGGDYDDRRRLDHLPVLHRTVPDVTVSGQSAGAGMAVQLHVAFSNWVSGAALFAGAPFYCAKSQLKILVDDCTLYYAPDTPRLISLTQQWGLLGQIDPTENLENDKVFLYHGTADTVLDVKVVENLDIFYESFIKNQTGGNITKMYTLNAEHSTPTLDYGGACNVLEKPFLGKCDYDGAGVALNAIYSPDTLFRTTQLDDHLFEFNQTRYMEFGTRYHRASDISMGEKGYVYIPRDCQGEKTSHCRVHIALHGCMQNLDEVGNVYAAHAGYNHWAEASSIVVLYPYVVISETLQNYKGCWDWWGYTGPDYGLPTGAQMSVIKNMVKALLPNMPTTVDVSSECDSD